MSVNTSIVRITPEQAQKYLERNTKNRNIRLRHVERLAADIIEGRWHMNGSSIVFDGDGTLLDGQHRLSAIVKAGVPVEVIVVRGVSNAAMATIDANVSRKAGDVAKLRGYVNTVQLVATVRLLQIAKTGKVGESDRISIGAIMEFLEAHPHIQDSVALAGKLYKTVPVTAVSAWHYLTFYLGKMPDNATTAMEVFETGIPHYRGDPIHIFRERCIKERGLFTAGALSRANGLWTLATAWNAFVRRDSRYIIRVQKSEVKCDGVDYGNL
jgi:hypothetical protein